jgi:hypothetical protein
MERGYIRPSKLPNGSPILFLDKKGWKITHVHDYRALNKITIKNNYSLFQINDLFDHLNGACYFSYIDLKSSYY